MIVVGYFASKFCCTKFCMSQGSQKPPEKSINCWCMSEWAGPGTSKIFIVPKSLGTLWDEEICKKKFFLSCLVSEIQLFVYIFGWISKWPPEVWKGSLVKFFEVSYYQKNFQPPTVHNSEDRGGVKMPYDFFVYICNF